jgi:hypothetical protein
MNQHRMRVVARLHHKQVVESLSIVSYRTGEKSARDPLTNDLVQLAQPEFGDDYYPPEIPVDTCPYGHGQQRIVDAGGNNGFVGEGVWWADLACGHQVVEVGSVEKWMVE